MNSFGERLLDTFSRSGNLCVGLDPSPEILSSWNLPQSISGLTEFGNRTLDSLGGNARIIKPQVAFYESFGSVGFRVLEDLLARAKAEGLLVIGDAKRGDIGSTMDGYYNAWLSDTAPFVVDALTLSPFLGFGSLESVIEKAHKFGKGVFVLVATSNTEASGIQLAKTDGFSVAHSIFTSLESANVRLAPETKIGPVGAVLGATLDLKKYGIDLASRTNVPILAPGFGAQGAVLSDARTIFGDLASQVIYNVSRSVLAAGPDQLPKAIEAAALELRKTLELEM